MASCTGPEGDRGDGGKGEAQMKTASVIELHEASHCVAAKMLGVEIVRVVCDPDDAYVTTRHRRARARAEALDMLERLAVIDLAGVAVDPVPGAAGDDERHAHERIEQIVRLRAGCDPGHKLTLAQRTEATTMLRRLMSRASSLVEDNMHEIMQTAITLAKDQA
jgi:hypothetical protein